MCHVLKSENIKAAPTVRRIVFYPARQSFLWPRVRVAHSKFEARLARATALVQRYAFMASSAVLHDCVGDPFLHLWLHR